MAGGPSWFLKVRAGAGAMPGAAVPAYLHRHGVPLVLAPRPTGTGAPFVVVDRFALALYPLLDAATGAEVGLSPAQWRELGAAVRRDPSPCAPTPELAALAGRERSGRAGASCFPRWRPRSPGPTRPTRSRARWPGSGRRTGT